MRNIFRCLLLATLALFPTILAADISNSDFLKIVDQTFKAKDRLLFILSGSSSTIARIPTGPFEPKQYAITVNGVNSHVTYFNQPPHSVFGTVPIQDIVSNWDRLVDVNSDLKPNVAVQTTNQAGVLAAIAVFQVESFRYNASTSTLSFTGQERVTQDVGKNIPTGHFGPTTVLVG